MSNYVLTTFSFLVDWGGSKVGFQDVSGLDEEVEVISYIDGSFAPGTAPMKSHGRSKFPDSITLKRGYFREDSEMQDWHKAFKLNDQERRTIIITLLDEKGDPVMKWTLYNAWPSKIAGVSLSATSNEPAIEEVTLCFEGFDKEHL